MAGVLVSAVVHAPADRVWERIGRFDAVAVTDHRTTIRVLPVTEGDRSYVAWSSRFGIDPAEERQLVGLIEENFAAGLRSLAEWAWPA